MNLSYYKKSNKIKKIIILPNGQSSPGSKHSVQQLSNGIRHIPQLSSLATHLQVAALIQSKKNNNSMKIE